LDFTAKRCFSRSLYRKKSSEKKSEEEPTVPISDEHILELLQSLPINSNHPRDSESAKQWDFAIRTMACYGLRPIEIKQLEVRKNEKDTLLQEEWRRYWQT
tara:strand:- start:112 stop:414 length:303 start_codon:yes stop_codon:yes gene_type:complete